MSLLAQLLGSLGVVGGTRTGGAGQDNRLVITDEDGLIHPDMLPAVLAANPLTKIAVVDADTGDDDTGNGSIIRPYETPAAALAANAGGPVILLLAPGTYASIVIEDAAQNYVSVLGFGRAHTTVTLLQFDNDLPDGDGFNRLFLDGVTVTAIEDITGQSELEVTLTGDTVVGEAEYVAGTAARHGKITVGADATLTTVPATNLDVVYVNGPWVSNEVPAGTKDGANTEFTTANTYQLGSLQIRLNGLPYDASEIADADGEGFTLEETAVLPDAADDDVLEVSYQTAVIPAPL